MQTDLLVQTPTSADQATVSGVNKLQTIAGQLSEWLRKWPRLLVCLGLVFSLVMALAKTAHNVPVKPQ